MVKYLQIYHRMSVQCNCHRSHMICSTLDIVNESGEPDMLV